MLGFSGSIVEQTRAAIKSSSCIRFSRVLYHLIGGHFIGVTPARISGNLMTVKLNLAAAQWKCLKRCELDP